MCHYIYTTYLCTVRELLQPAGWRPYQIITLKHFSLPSVKERTIFLPEVLVVFALDLSCYKTSVAFNRYQQEHISTFYGKPELKNIHNNNTTMKAWKRICPTSRQQFSVFYTLIDYANDVKIFKT